MIEGGVKIATSILLFLSPATPQAEVTTPNTPVIERSEAVLPEPLRIPGPALVEDKRLTGSIPPEGVTSSVMGRRQLRKVRFS